MTGRTTLVLSGGSALGAYQGGAYEALERAGLRPDRIVAVSIGAVNAAIIAGNPPERRVERLRRFWGEAGLSESAWGLGGSLWGDGRVKPLRSSLLGSPAVFRPRFPGAFSLLPGMPGDTSLYDLGPLRASLERAIDFQRLNGGDPGPTVVAIDVVTGDELRFEAGADRIGPEHLLASSGFLPFFPPVEIDGRLLGDGGLGANLPLEAALGEEPAEDHLCIAIDLFSRHGGRPGTVGQAVDRQLDLLLSSQTRKAIDGLRRTHALRRHLRVLAGRERAGAAAGGAEVDAALAEAAGAETATTLLVLAHAAVPGDIEMRAFDYSRDVLAERWEAGRAEMEAAMRRLDGHRAGKGEFAVLAGNAAAIPLVR